MDKKSNQETSFTAGNGYRLPSGHDRIYFHHIPKAAGSSLTISILSGDGQDGASIRRKATTNIHKRTIYRDKVYLYFNRFLIQEGNYYYAHSHYPSHYLCLPSNTFTITCFRDPLQRIISLYGMIQKLKEEEGNKSLRNWIKWEMSWLGRTVKSNAANDLVSFAKALPKRFLMNQLYMFSRDLNIEKAVNNALKVDHILYVEKYEEGIQGLSQKLGLDLAVKHTNSGKCVPQIPVEQLEKLHAMLDLEYEFLNVLYNRTGGYKYS